MRHRLPARPELLLLCLLPLRAAAQDCPLGRISYVFIDNHSIFDLSQKDPDSPLFPAYRLANRIHFRTREDFLRSEILFREGECLDPLLLEETGRILRRYPFIARADVYPVEQPDGSRHVVVDTQDDWTTKIDLGLAFDEGFRIEGLRALEENVLGRGIRVGFFFRERKELRDLGVEVASPRLVGTRWDGWLSMGRTRVGTFFAEGLGYPFLGEIGHAAVRQQLRWREGAFPYALPSGGPLTHLLLPLREEFVEFSVAMRIGHPGNLTIFGVGLSREALALPDVPDGVELVEEGDFSRTRAATPEEVAPVLSQARERSATRLNFLLGQRNLRFVQRRGLDALRGVQDVQLGSEVTVSLGRSLSFSRGADGTHADDLHARVTIFAGDAGPTWVANTRLTLEGRRVFAGGTDGASWRDVLGEFDTYLYWQPFGEASHTIFARVSAAGGWSPETPFQLTLGGRDQLRGYPEEAFPGSRRIVLTIEDRLYLSWPAPELFDFGLTLFADVGAMWDGGVPYGSGSGLRGSLGMGLRLGFPPGSASTVRIDVALPVEPGVTRHDLRLRITLEELLGLLPGFDDFQILRSRRSGVDPDFLRLPWEPR